MKSLFLVCCDTDDGENLDWFIIAQDRAEAVKLWSQVEMVADMGIDEPDKVFIINAATVPQTMSSQALDWNDHGVHLA